ncbi:MAG: class I SAM-dependent methyltransferase [Raineya sp.]
MKRSFLTELLDNEDISEEDLRRNLQELERINTLLGGYTTTLKGIARLVKNKKQENKSIRIVDVGSGGGDTLRKIAEWGRKNDLSLSLIGIDLKKTCIEYAQEHSQKYPEIAFIHADYARTQPQADIITSSLFCHHLTDQELLHFLQWSKQNAEWGFVINDLHRHAFAYHSIKYLTKFFSKSCLVKHDAPLSVRRALNKQEWVDILQEAGIKHYSIDWLWAFRWLIVGKTLL